ncbi:MAG: lipoprotein [Planctomycetota bacterium]|nr:MAG: lipoprotein [Planctomycetota bacterium]
MGVLSRCTSFALLVALALTSCASESHRTLTTQVVATYGTNYSGERAPLAIGKFHNSSPYMRGLFSEGPDRLGSQAKSILQTHLSLTNRFELLDRDNLDELARESGLSGRAQQVEGATLVITGEVTEFGHKTTGDRWLFGLLGRGKTQTAYAKISLNVLDVTSSKVIHAVQGAAEFDLSNREVIGTGGTSGYDSTLNGKVLNLAIIDAVNKLVADLDAGSWSTSA